MDAFKRFSIAALATILVAGAAPAFAQDTRDTRPQQGRPIIEHGDEGGGSVEPGQKQRLPKSTEGVRCLVKEGHGGPEILAVNGTGQVIPAGTVVTFYMQPGNVQKLFKLTDDWAPGQSLAIPVKLAELPDDAECSLKLKSSPEPEMPADDPVPAAEPEPEPEDQPAGQDWVPPEGWVSIQSDQFSCKVYDHQYAWEPTPSILFFANTSGGTLPAGTKVIITMPDGSIEEFTLGSPYPPGGEFTIELPAGSLENYECSFEVILP
ncbi:hypothetical protein [Devosia sp. Root105]|uniref:hypothetical protein n=1 Tax=Devosia sp. Root105 TaxID=1736423 RepID=UPI000A9393CD|nr:hypothetical protein [Devosia sp. Root105]